MQAYSAFAEKMVVRILLSFEVRVLSFE